MPYTVSKTSVKQNKTTNKKKHSEQKGPQSRKRQLADRVFNPSFTKARQGHLQCC